MLLILRRQHLGRSSAVGLNQVLTTLGVPVFDMRNDEEYRGDTLPTHVLRWGCTSSITDIRGLDDCPTVPVLNKASSIHIVNNKSDFLNKLNMTLPHASPAPTILPARVSRRWEHGRLHIGQFPLMLNGEGPFILRPHRHAQGRHVYKFSTMAELRSILRRKPRTFHDGGYIRPFIDKVKEVRVYVVNGKVVTVANKTPSDPSAIAWNVAQGGRFDVVRWDEWPVDACHLAIKVWRETGLDISGVDMMIDRDGRPWLIEANSAPSLPFNEDGTTTYRHECLAKGIAARYNGGAFDLGEHPNYDQTNWRSVIHPAIWSNHVNNS